MKIRIGQIEFSDLTPKELDELVKKYGAGDAAKSPTKQGSPSPSGSATAVGTGHTDTVMLKRFIDAGSAGVEAHVVGDILGRRGKATRTGIIEWARRVGLPDGADPYEVTRIGTKRGFRIKTSLMEVARSISGQ